MKHAGTEQHYDEKDDANSRVQRAGYHGKEPRLAHGACQSQGHPDKIELSWFRTRQKRGYFGNDCMRNYV